MDDRINVALGVLLATEEQIARAGDGPGLEGRSQAASAISESEVFSQSAKLPAAQRPRLLITRRRKGTVYAGYWEFPGGKVEPGESIEACLVREFEEEVGLVIRVERALERIEHDYAHGRVRLHPFYCRLIRGQVRNLEVAEHRWVDVQELGDFTFPEANLAIVQRLRADLG